MLEIQVTRAANYLVSDAASHLTPPPNGWYLPRYFGIAVRTAFR
jgi:hypothetical protein